MDWVAVNRLDWEISGPLGWVAEEWVDWVAVNQLDQVVASSLGWVVGEWMWWMAAGYALLAVEGSA